MANLMVIHGSHRRNGVTEQLATYVIDQLGDTVRCETFPVRNLSIDHCIACTACSETGDCILKDDMDLIYASLKTADAVLISSPVYFNHMTSLLKQLIDRLEPYFFRKVKLKTPQNIPDFYFVFSAGIKLKNETKIGILQTVDILTKAFNGQVKGCIWIEETDLFSYKNLLVENQQSLDLLSEKIHENLNKIRPIG